MTGTVGCDMHPQRLTLLPPVTVLTWPVQEPRGSQGPVNKVQLGAPWQEDGVTGALRRGGRGAGCPESQPGCREEAACAEPAQLGPQELRGRESAALGTDLVMCQGLFRDCRGNP